MKHRGITPAYAGKRVHSWTRWSTSEDHPRVCGEKRSPGFVTEEMRGSPPRMRGKARGRPLLFFRLRITPAYAGKREKEIMANEVSMDHPRVCGEKDAIQTQNWWRRGSPPRMRGKVLDTIRLSWLPWITPAYAGKRLKRSRSTVPPVAIVPLFPSVCNKPVVSDGSPAGRDAPLFLPAENAVPASPAYNLRSL